MTASFWAQIRPDQTLRSKVIGVYASYFELGCFGTTVLSIWTIKRLIIRKLNEIGLWDVLKWFLVYGLPKKSCLPPKISKVPGGTPVKVSVMHERHACSPNQHSTWPNSAIFSNSALAKFHPFWPSLYLLFKDKFSFKIAFYRWFLKKFSLRRA